MMAQLCYDRSTPETCCCASSGSAVRHVSIVIVCAPRTRPPSFVLFASLFPYPSVRLLGGSLGPSTTKNLHQTPCLLQSLVVHASACSHRLSVHLAGLLCYHRLLLCVVASFCSTDLNHWVQTCLKCHKVIAKYFVGTSVV